MSIREVLATSILSWFNDEPESALYEAKTVHPLLLEKITSDYVAFLDLLVEELRELSRRTGWLLYPEEAFLCLEHAYIAIRCGKHGLDYILPNSKEIDAIAGIESRNVSEKVRELGKKFVAILAKQHLELSVNQDGEVSGRGYVIEWDTENDNETYLLMRSPHCHGFSVESEQYNCFDSHKEAEVLEVITGYMEAIDALTETRDAMQSYYESRCTPTTHVAYIVKVLDV